MHQTILLSLLLVTSLFSANDSTITAATLPADTIGSVAEAELPVQDSVVKTTVQNPEVTSADTVVAAPQTIEQAILAEPMPAGEMVRRARFYLLKALISHNKEQAVQTIEYLRSQYSSVLCPFSGMEEGLAYMHAAVYDSALTALVKERRLFAPKARKAVTYEDQCVVDARSNNLRSSRLIQDELFVYLADNFPKTASQIDSLVLEIQNSSVETFYKDAAPAFVPVVFNASWGRTEASTIQKVSTAGSAFSAKYPANENGAWLEANFVEPLQKRASNEAKDSNDPIQNHLYTSGVGFEFLSGIGMFAGDLKDEFHHKYWSYYAAVPIQISRFVFTPFLSFGTLETRNNRQFSDVLWEEDSDLYVYSSGISLGFVVFDSRYVKFEPFVGIASAESILPDDNNDYYYYADKPNNNYYRLRKYVKHENSVEYLLGATGEVRLLTIASRNVHAPLNSISLRVKYIAQFLDHDFGYKKIEGVSHKLLAGVGFFIW